MTRKCPFMSGVASTPKTEVGGLVFTSAQIGKAVFVECIEEDCMAWGWTDSLGYHCKKIDGKCH